MRELERRGTFGRNVTRRGQGIGSALRGRRVIVNLLQLQPTLPRVVDARLTATVPDLPLFGAPDWRRAREGRGFSRAEIARAATALLPHLPVAERHVVELERNGRSRPEQLRARLDLLYGADGHSGPETLGRRWNTQRTSRTCIPLAFPAYWRGPVWLRCRSDRAGEQGQVQWQWGHWKVNVLVQEGRVLAPRKADAGADPAPLVWLPRGWFLEYGVGQYPQACDVGPYWSVSDATGFRWAYQYFSEVFRAAFRTRAGEDAPDI